MRAKGSLQVQAPGKACTLNYDQMGLKKLLKVIPAGHTVVCEATRGYERTLISFLHQKKIPVVLVNPDRIRTFVKSEGLRAKPDPLDAAMLLRFAQQKQPFAREQQPKEQIKLAAYLDRRAHLSASLTQEKNRLENSPLRSIAISRR